MKNLFVPISLVTALLWAAPLWPAGEPARAVVVRTAPIKAGPAFGARTVATVEAGREVETGRRFGGWQQVTLSGDGVDGWVRVYQIRTDVVKDAAVEQRAASEGGVLTGLVRGGASLFGRREMQGQDPDNMTATIGIRGLSEADLENARPDAEEFKRLEQYAADGKAARAHAKRSGLKRARVKYLPVPEDEG